MGSMNFLFLGTRCCRSFIPLSAAFMPDDMVACRLQASLLACLGAAQRPLLSVAPLSVYHDAPPR